MNLIQNGSPHARILVVGEAPGEDEIRLGKPFVGMSGREFDRQLAQAHWSRAEMFITNVCHERPPGNEIEAFFANKTQGKRERLSELVGRYPRQPVLDGLAQLQRDIDRLRPTLILALGNTPLWALTGQLGIMRWRGSTMPASGGPVDGHSIKLVCTLHPAAVLREQVLRFVAIADLKRAHTESVFPEIRRPAWDFTVPTTIVEIQKWIEDTPNEQGRIIADVENIVSSGTLICLGMASSPTRAICVPFVKRTGDNPHYWPDATTERDAIQLCLTMLHRKETAFHNGLHDMQIIAKNYGVMPRFTHDTMAMQHVAFPGMLGGKIDPISGKVDKKGSSLSLSFCASLYCDYYKFWKNDGRGWDAEINSEEDYWKYNCEDCVRTYEIMEKLESILKRDNLWDQYLFEMSLFPSVFEMMFRGTAFDNSLRFQFDADVKRETTRMQEWINKAIGHNLNVASNKQMKQLFYDDLQCEKILHRKTKKATLDDKALDRIVRKQAVLKPLIERIQALRTLNKFEENFLQAKLRGIDGRLCGAFNVISPETMRFSSNVDAFGGGLNLQNLPRNAEE